jgi:hypothetical protein
MIERVGVNLWDFRTRIDAAICITTNGEVNNKGRAIMGRGVARQAADLFPASPRLLAESLQIYGNHVVCLINEPTITLVTFPVKHYWSGLASLELIERSAQELVALTNEMKWREVYLPRPGCGNGGLIWAGAGGAAAWRTVQSVLQPLFDDRFIVVAPKVEAATAILR